jgi:hypothetical protein
VPLIADFLKELQALLCQGNRSPCVSFQARNDAEVAHRLCDARLIPKFVVEAQALLDDW